MVHNITKPSSVTIYPPSANECADLQEGKSKKTLVCVASGFYPDHVTVSWRVDGVTDEGVVTTDHSALRVDDHYQITSRFRVQAKSWYNARARFQCTISFFNGTNWTDHTAAEVSGDPREKYMRVTHAAKLSYGVFIIKNVIYGIFVMILAWKLGLGRSAEK
ncbi:hypothetical protein CRUP_004590 [Coryphaenoides rupestris]|nr:hypothetical protein CRUP_004590 [Coryphaenoides rupestris]